MSAAARRDMAAARYRSALARLGELEDLGAHAMFEPARLGLLREYTLSDLSDAAASYEAVLSLVTVSRCPFTGDAVALAVDTGGVDGPWWNYSVPRRPLPVGLPPTLIGFDGAVRFDTDPPVVPYLVGAGPQVPTVIPRVLETDGVIAVVSSLTVGGSSAWVICYFAALDVEDAPMLDDWGTDHFVGRDPDGAPVQLHVGVEVRDAYLKAWVERGRLRWIGPGDASLTVRQGVADCPYLGIEGSADAVWVVGGQILADTEISEGVLT